MAIRTHGIHGGDSPSPSTRWGTCTNTAVTAANPASHPAMKANPVGLGWSVCNTNSTAGIIYTGESATPRASGNSSPSNDPAD